MQEVHVSKVSNSKQFSLGEIKQFLPIHQQAVIDNLKIIFNNYAISNYPLNLILIPDTNLKLDYNLTFVYTNLRAIWSEDFQDNPEKLRTTLNLGCILLNYIGSIDQESITQEKEKDVESWVTRTDIIAATNTQKLEQRLKLSNKSKQSKKILGFNLVLDRGRIILIIGVNIHANQSFILSCFLLRQWNLNRLKAQQMGGQIDIDLMHRVCEHLFSIARGFVREVKSDYNTYKNGINDMLIKLANDGFNKEIICQSMKSHKLNLNNLPHEMLLLRWQVTYRKQLSQHMLWQLICSLVTQWLLHTPISCSCSYGSHVVLDETTNSLTIYLASYYQTPTTTNKISDSSLANCTKQIQTLLIDYSNKQQQNVQANSLKKSINLLMKYQATPDKNDIALSRQITPSDDSYSNNSLNDSFISQISNESISQKINLKDIAKMENQIYQILKAIHSKKSILTPTEIEDIIRKYVRRLQRIYPPCLLSELEYQALCTLDAINQLLSSQQIYLIIKKNNAQSSLILSYFLQKGKYKRAMQIGKLIANDHLVDLYKKSLQNGLNPSKHTIIPYYLKKIIQFYSEQLPPFQIKADQVSIPDLVEIIETKNYNSSIYSSIMEFIYPQIFKHFIPTIKIMSPVLSYFLQLLLNNDHHEELVYSFIGQIIFEVCYFPTQIKLNSLSNAAYMEEKHNKCLSLKEKKILYLIREGGLKGFGYQIKKELSQIIQMNKQCIENQEIIYHLIKANKSIQLQLLFKLLSSCHYTASTNKIAKYLEHKNYYSSVLNKHNALLCFIILKNKQSEHKFEVKKQINSIDDTQFNSISERILKSESGIFQQMIKLNPQIKIAGIQLKTVIKNLAESRNGTISSQKAKGQLDEQAAIQAYMNKQFKQNYEYVSLAWSLKQKYLKYPSLSQSQKTYFRDCATVVIDHKQSILQYVALSNKIRNLKKTLKDNEEANLQQTKSK